GRAIFILRIRPTTGSLPRNEKTRVADRSFRSRNARDVILRQFGMEEFGSVVLIDEMTLMHILARRESLRTWICRWTWTGFCRNEFVTCITDLTIQSTLGFGISLPLAKREKKLPYILKASFGWKQTQR